MPQNPAQNLIPAEIDQFNALAAEWWDATGPMAPLHRMNPTRLEYIIDTLTARFGSVKNLRILDVGCGGGLVAEPLARLGANVTGIDGAEDLVAIARAHAAAQGLAIDYRAGLTTDLLQEKNQFEVVLGLEVIEHVPDAAKFVDDLSSLTVSGGTVIFSTLNRSPSSWAFGIMAAEYVLRWLPRGTHRWRQFVKPSELFALCTTHGLEPLQTMGLVYHARDDSFMLDSDNLKINYFLTARKT